MSSKKGGRRDGNKSIGVRLLSAIKRTEGEPITAGELMRRLTLPRSRKTDVRRALTGLIKAGEIVKSGMGFLPSSHEGRATGRLVGHPDGFGFVVSEEGGEDVYVPRKEMRGAMHGDRVRVKVIPGRGGRTQSSHLKILERGVTTLVGRLDKWRGRWRVLPLEQRFGRELWLQGKGRGTVREGDLVQVAITGYPDAGEPLTGEVIRPLGDGNDPERDSDVMLAGAGVDPRFPPPVLAEAERLPSQVFKTHYTKVREDLIDLPTVTIDGENAKDFDDAISFKVGGKGSVTLWVHIADVDEFAPEGSILDKEAHERGTSIYLPDRVVPMFPEQLSNGICSLRPDENRLTMTVEMTFNRLGRRRDVKIYPSIIRSDARLTYEQVNSMLVDKDKAVRAQYDYLIPMLEGMERLAAKRQGVRAERGSLDFDLPEMMIVLGDGGEIREIIQQERAVSHRMIEEFMLAANEAVAEWLTEGKSPVVYRIHEEPDLERLAAFVPVARNVLGPDVPIMSIREAPSPKTMQQILAAAEGHPGEHVLNSLLVRSLKQARYASENLGHYGLASPCYCHFTSPIRRYPDLMIHRLVKQRLAEKAAKESASRPPKALPWLGELEGTASHASARERRAVGLERQVVATKKCRYLSNHVGDTLDGVVSSVAKFGMFIDLAGIGHEGMVHVEQLPQPVVHDERHMALIFGTDGIRLQVGNPVRVTVLSVDVLAGKVSLDLTDDQFEEAPAS
jgi:ribonuclease R